VIGGEPVPLPLFPYKMSHALAWDWIRTFDNPATNHLNHNLALLRCRELVLFKSIADLTCPVAWISNIEASGGNLLRAIRGSKRGGRYTYMARTFIFYVLHQTLLGKLDEEQLGGRRITFMNST